jgi:hypothetical protein
VQPAVVEGIASAYVDMGMPEILTYFNTLENLRSGNVVEALSTIQRHLPEVKDATLKNLLKQTQARVLRITEEGDLKIASQLFTIKDRHLKNGFKKMREAGVEHLDFISNGVISPPRYQRILEGLGEKAEALVRGDRVRISGFVDRAVVEVKREGTIVRFRILSQREQYGEVYRERLTGVQSRIQERPKVQTQVQDHQSLSLKVERDEAGNPLRGSDGKLLIAAQGADFTQFYKDVGLLKDSATGKIKVNFVISWVLESDLKPEEIDQEAVFRAVFGELYEELKAQIRKNVKFFAYPSNSQNLASDLIQKTEREFYRGLPFEPREDVTFVLSADEIRSGHYGSLKDLRQYIHWILQEPLDARSLTLIAEGLAAEGLIQDPELLDMLRNMDPETLAEVNRNRLIPSGKSLLEEMEFKIRSVKTASTMA